MKPGLKITLAIAVTAILTFFATSHLVRKGTISAFTHKVLEMEVINEVGRIESWDRLEGFLVKGCNDEALELIRHQRASAFSSLSYHMGDDVQLKKVVQERNTAIAQRLEKQPKFSGYQIPACDEPKPAHAPD